MFHIPASLDQYLSISAPWSMKVTRSIVSHCTVVSVCNLFSSNSPAPRGLVILLQIFVRHEGKVVRDEVLWDVNNPTNQCDNYAAACCKDLGLTVGWYEVITAYLQERIKEARKVRSQHVSLSVIPCLVLSCLVCICPFLLAYVAAIAGTGCRAYLQWL